MSGHLWRAAMLASALLLALELVLTTTTISHAAAESLNNKGRHLVLLASNPLSSCTEPRWLTRGAGTSLTLISNTVSLKVAGMRGPRTCDMIWSVSDRWQCSVLVWKWLWVEGRASLWVCCQFKLLIRKCLWCSHFVVVYFSYLVYFGPSRSDAAISAPYIFPFPRAPRLSTLSFAAFRVPPNSRMNQCAKSVDTTGFLCASECSCPWFTKFLPWVAPLAAVQ